MRLEAQDWGARPASLAYLTSSRLMRNPVSKHIHKKQTNKTLKDGM